MVNGKAAISRLLFLRLSLVDHSLQAACNRSSCAKHGACASVSCSTSCILPCISHFDSEARNFLNTSAIGPARIRHICDHWVISSMQVLLLWDRLLGYDSLDLLSVLAASVLVFRANLVMQVRDTCLSVARRKKYKLRCGRASSRKLLFSYRYRRHLPQFFTWKMGWWFWGYEWNCLAGVITRCSVSRVIVVAGSCGPSLTHVNAVGRSYLQPKRASLFSSSKQHCLVHVCWCRQVSDAATVMEIFSDGRQLEVVPLLQAFMFPAW